MKLFVLAVSPLGTGYHIYMDNFYTSPKLFMDLDNMKFGACGTYRENRRGCPRGRANALTKKSERGSIRWIREGPLVFVKSMDTWEVFVCSTIHHAFSGETVQKRVKDAKDGRWMVKDIPCPTPVLAYNKNMGGVDLSNQLIQYYSIHMKTARWYTTVLLQFLDIVTTNAFISHREISSIKQVQPMTHKDFMMELVCQLCGTDKTDVLQNRSQNHVPAPTVMGTDPCQKARKGRLRCQQCLQVDKKKSDTPWMCQACNVPLCVTLDRNCFLSGSNSLACPALHCTYVFEIYHLYLHSKSYFDI
ncbi:piggyBac transposable element-derived protein 4-like [Thalassophryne amazonica]|uniref:piggyBac transposable element-derived protein 4-like n=1 Tax=Thalassophryne amazonica TaxID=390379 RepID=UPI00147091D9|nr:piggyBac transposable element-derived protein 4-like [Thalassophryne amazonica]